MVICLAGTALPLFQSLKSRTAVRTIIITDPDNSHYLLAPVSLPNPSEDVYQLVNFLVKYRGVLQPIVEVFSEDVAIFQYSGGTTGIPQGGRGFTSQSDGQHHAIRRLVTAYGQQADQEAILAAYPVIPCVWDGNRHGCGNHVRS